MTRTKRFLIASSAALVVLAVVGFAGYWFLIRSDAPPPVDLAAAVSTLGGTVATTVPDGPAADTTVPPPTTTVPPPTTRAAGDSDPAADASAGSGETWAIDAAAGSFVGYRVEEELVSIGATTAVGRTPLLTGSLELAGTTLAAVQIDADLRGLESDDSRRDRALRRQALEIDTFPTAGFALTQPVELGVEPAEGAAFSGTATGDLTLHGVTREVEVPLEGQLVEGAIVVVGSIPIEFADYDIDPPTSFGLLSVDSSGIMEFQLVFRPA